MIRWRGGVTVADGGEDAALPLVELEALLDRRNHLAALTLLGRAPAIEEWKEPRAIHQGIRMLMRVGALDRATKLVLREYRRRPRNPFSHYGYVYEVFRRRGPVHARIAMDRAPEGAPKELEAFLLYLRGTIALALRDFGDLEAALVGLEASQRPTWAHALRARSLSARGDRDGAIAEARRGIGDRSDLELVEVLTELLVETGRLDEAVAFAEEREAANECGFHSLSLARLAGLAKKHDQALAAVDRAAKRLPLADAILARSFDVFRAHLAYQTGDLETAIARARKVDDEAMTRFAEKLEQSKASGAIRRVLDVPYVAQHHSTCVPATLTALLRYAGEPADHVEVADAICYDGTKSHIERSWAESRGLVVREFTLTAETAKALVDRDVPFSLVMLRSTMGHMVAVVGYDDRLGTFVLRDPNRPDLVEADGEKLLEAMAPYGPRAAVVLPASRAARIEGVTLPDAPLYDVLHRVHVALERSDVEAARRELAEMIEKAPRHRLTAWAKRAVALDAGDLPTAVSVSRELLAASELDLRSRLLIASANRSLLSASAFQAELEAMTAGSGPELAPLLAMLAGHVVSDARRSAEARLLARKALRRDPASADAVSVLAVCEELRGDSKSAHTLHRIASCLDPTSEPRARRFFSSAINAETVPLALAELETRARSAWARSGLPAITCAEALSAVGREADARRMIERVVEEGADDLATLDAAFEAAAKRGMRGSLRRILRAVDTSGAVGFSRRARAASLEVEGKYDEAFDAWRKILEDEPRAPGTAEEVARLAAMTGRELEALRLLEKIPDPPRSFRKLRGKLEPSLRTRGAHFRECAREHRDQEALLEWSMSLANRGKLNAAWKRASEARANAPRSVGPRLALSEIAARRGDAKTVHRQLVAALIEAIDHPEAIHRDLASASTIADLRKRAKRILARAKRRTLDGTAYQAVFAEIAGELPATEVLGLAASARAARPELARTWLVHASALEVAGKPSRQLALLEKALAKFPGDPDVMLAAGDAFVRTSRFPDARRLFRRAFLVCPSPPTALALADDYLREERGARAEWLIRYAAARFPRDVQLSIRVANFEIRADQKSKAIELMRAVVRRNRNDVSAWLAYREAGAIGGSRGLATNDAESNARAQPDDLWRWLIVARLQRVDGDWDAALHAARRATELRPSSVEVIDAHVLALAGAGNLEQALRTCASKKLHGAERVRLLLRRAMLELQLGRQAGPQTLEEIIRGGVSARAAHNMLADLAVRSRDVAAVLRHAKPMLLLSRIDIQALKLAARAEAHLGRPKRSRRYWDRALALAPDDQEAFVAGIELRSHARDREACLELVRRFAKVDAAAASFELVRAELVMEQRNEAIAEIESIVLRKPAAPDLFQRTVEHFAREASFDALVERLRPRLLEAERPIIETWAALLETHSGAGGASFLRELSRSGGELAGWALAAVVGERSRNRRGWGWLVARWLGVARRSTVAWAAVQVALVSRGRHLLAFLWARDWKRRENVRASALANLALSYDALGFLGAGVKTRTIALEMPHDESLARMRVHLALRLATLGRIERAQELVAVVSDPNDAHETELRRLVALLAEHASDPRRRIHAIRESYANRARSTCHTLMQQGAWSRQAADAQTLTVRAIRGRFAWARVFDGFFVSRLTTKPDLPIVMFVILAAAFVYGLVFASGR